MEAASESEQASESEAVWAWGVASESAEVARPARTRSAPLPGWRLAARDTLEPLVVWGSELSYGGLD
jgi:hypothetical protein